MILVDIASGEATTSSDITISSDTITTMTIHCLYELFIEILLQLTLVASAFMYQIGGEA